MASLKDITKEELLEEIREIGSNRLLRQYRNTILPSIVLIDLFNSTDEKEVYVFLAGYANTPSTLLVDIYRKSDDADVRAKLASHNRIPQNVLQSILENATFTVKFAAAGNRTITPETASILAKDDDPVVRCLLAERKDLFQRFQA